MKLFNFLRKCLIYGSVIGTFSVSQAAIVAKDADGKEWNFQQPGRVLVVIGNNAATAQEARDCGKALDEFQGRKDFRMVVVVDLRGSLAHWAKGYTVRRMQQDLNEEAKRITPFYRKNGNKNDPRKEIGAIPDFEGKICEQMKWSRNQKALRVLIFNKNGQEAMRFDSVNHFKPIHQKVFELLSHQ